MPKKGMNKNVNNKEDKEYLPSIECEN
jgi:hypothetical protein